MIKPCELHDDLVIVYDTRHTAICPVCDLVKERDTLQDNITKLHDTIAELECETEDLKRGQQ